MMNQRNFKRIFLPIDFFWRDENPFTTKFRPPEDAGCGSWMCPFSAHFVFLAIQGAQRISKPPALQDVVMLAGTSCR